MIQQGIDFMFPRTGDAVHREQEVTLGLERLMLRVQSEIARENGYCGHVCVRVRVDYHPGWDEPPQKSLTQQCSPSASENPGHEFIATVEDLGRLLRQEIGSFETGTYEVTLTARHSSRMEMDE